MTITSRLSVAMAVCLALGTLSASQANAERAARGTLEVVNRTDKNVTCRSVSYLKERAKGEYSRMGAWATAEAGKTGKGNKRFTLSKRLGAICYFNEDYPTKPSLDATNGISGGLVCRTDHFPTKANSIISITVYSNMSNCPVGSRSGRQPRKARPKR